jgi:hypothetical protein
VQISGTFTRFALAVSLAGAGMAPPASAHLADASRRDWVEEAAVIVLATPHVPSAAAVARDLARIKTAARPHSVHAAFLTPGTQSRIGSLAGAVARTSLAHARTTIHSGSLLRGPPNRF